jgi:Tol biopolymer transport system component
VPAPRIFGLNGWSIAADRGTVRVESRQARGASALLLSAAIAVALAAPPVQAAPANFASASVDGSKVFFTATDKLVPGDTDRGFRDVYERSYDSEPGVETYVTRELSTGPTGGNDAYPASYQGASADGNAVFFSTEESLVPEDSDHSVDIYRHDATGTTLVSRAASSCLSGGCGNGPKDSTFRGVTPSGGAGFFQTTESLAPEDTDEAADVYMRDLESEPPTTTLVSRSAPSCVSGGCGNGAGPATFVGASANGKRVFFETSESLTPEDTDGESDVYMRDLESEPPNTVLVSAEGICPEGVSASECRPKFRAVSADGSRVFFTTSERLSSADEDGASDVYVWDEGTISLLSIGSSGGNGTAPATFAGSRAGGTRVFFQTTESLAPEDTDEAADVYMRDLEGEPPTTTLVSRADASCETGGCGNGATAATFAGASSNGDSVFFQTTESLGPEDTNSVNDVYARDLGEGTTTLVSQPDPACEEEACGPAAAAIFAANSAGGTEVFFTTDESLVSGDPESNDVYVRDLGTSTTTLESPAGICPLPGETGCDASFDGASEDGSRVFFTTARRLTADDLDSDPDVYERAGGRTRLVSAGNSVALGPATPVLTAISPGPSGETLTPSVLGHAAANTAIKVYTTPDCSGETVAGTVAQLEGGGVSVAVEAGRTTGISATATDESGITSECSNVLYYTQEYTSAPPNEEGGGGEGGGGSGGGGGSTSTSPALAPAPASASSVKTYGGGRPYVAPVTRITFGPAFKTRVRHPVFRFTDTTGQPGTIFVCKVDRLAWKPCASPTKLKKLHGGRHVFVVKGVNAVGVWEARPVKRAFKLVGARGARSHKRRPKRRRGR